MNLQWTPMRWPAAWKNPETLRLLQDTPINCLLVESGTDLGPLAGQAQRSGLAIASKPPMGVSLSKGEWPGIQMAARGSGVSAGPTGVPWLNSNGWRVRLENALHPDTEVWIDAPPKGPRLFPDSFAMAFLDAAAYGGRWLISLDDATASAIAAQEPRALEGWNKLIAAARFFDAHKPWADYSPEAVVGVVSDFTGDHEFLSGETLNLLARDNQQYRVIVKGSISDASWKGLRAILYLDPEPPLPPLRREIEALVAGGKLLIAGPQWGRVAGPLAADQENPRYDIRVVGKGKVALAKAEPDDPYTLANDSVLLVSHRYELLRFFNGGAVSAYLAAAPNRKSALLHMLFYSNRGPQDASVHIAARYRSAKLWTADRAEPRSLEVLPGRDGVELHLPAMSQYAAAELEI
ncbi:MAG TPA: hypothetical protein VME43_00035 [Bryobacteraceae bacterium]|nr:hypothetical protein [Bryobacteraceae bacterium]